MVIQTINISEALDILFSTPQLQNLNNKKEWKGIFQYFMEQMYINTPQEIIDFMNYKLNDRMIKTTFNNYGIDPSYYENLNYLIQKDLVFYLEYLFQNKGSLEIFKLFQQLFSQFYDHIDFYNVSINKLLAQSGNYKLAYMLKPLYLKNEESRIYFPETPINQSGKFLMDLKNFHKFKMFPIDTNLIYIHFEDIYSNSNNMVTFFNGVRSYANTRYQSNFINLYIQKTMKREVISFTDIETVLLYLNFANIRKKDDITQKNFDFLYGALDYNTSLIFKPNMLDTLEDLLYTYKKLDYSNRKETTDLHRRWQFLMSSHKTNQTRYGNFEQLEDYIQKQYPNLYIAFANMDDVDFIFLLIDMYVSTLQVVDINDEYSPKYINTLFQTYIIGPVFIKEFFEPLFKLFVNYFFPANMDFTNTIGNLVKVKDKFNSVSTEENIKCEMDLNTFSRHLHHITKHDLWTLLFENNNVKFNNKQSFEIIRYLQDKNNIDDNIEFKRIKGNYVSDFIKNNGLYSSLDLYIWKIKRNAGISTFDYESLKKDEYLITDDTETYQFYNIL